MAKVARGRMMIDYAEWYPEYGFEKNKGYGSEEHRAALKSSDRVLSIDGRLSITGFRGWAKISLPKTAEIFLVFIEKLWYSMRKEAREAATLSYKLTFNVAVTIASSGGFIFCP